MAVLCESSGVVRDAFLRRGHSAVSCDLVSSESPGPHLQADCRSIDWSGHDLVIAFPPCTYLCRSGARWWHIRPGFSARQKEALDLVRWLLDMDVPRLCLENPSGLIGTIVGPATQWIQPWQFGHPETKLTGLWLRNLPALVPTRVMPPERRSDNLTGKGQNRLPERKSRSRERSRTYEGVAQAMAEQWGSKKIYPWS